MVLGTKRAASLIASILVVLSVGCRELPQSTHAPRQIVAVEASLQEPWVPDPKLKAMSLQSLWKTEYPDEVRAIYYVGRGVYLVDAKNVLVKLSRERGTVDWVFPLKKHKLEFPPCLGRSAQPDTPPGAGELFIVLDGRLLCSIDNANGMENWRMELPFFASTGPVVRDPYVYIGSYNSRLYAVNRIRKIDEGSFLTGGVIVARPCVGSDAIFVGSEDNHLYRVSYRAEWVAGDSWAFPTKAKIVADPVFFSSGRLGEYVFVASTDYSLYCHSTSEDLVLWAYPAGAPIRKTPFLSRDGIFFVTEEQRGGSTVSTLHALALGLRKYTPRWRHPRVKEVIAAGPKALYVLSDEGEVLALSYKVGKVVSRISVKGFDFVVANDADQGREKEDLGFFILAKRSGYIQAVQEISLY